VQVLGLRGVRHAADGVGGMLGLAPSAWTPSTRFGSTRLAAGGPNRPVSGCRAETAKTRGPLSGTGKRWSDCFRDLWLLRRWNPCIDSETFSGSRIGACEHRHRRHAWIRIVFLLFCNCGAIIRRPSPRQRLPSACCLDHLLDRINRHLGMFALPEQARMGCSLYHAANAVRRELGELSIDLGLDSPSLIVRRGRAYYDQRD
jgi:hypothetical protein